MLSPTTPDARAAPSPWELAAEAIAVKIRWFGVLIGCAIVNLRPAPDARVAVLNAILVVGAVYTLIDTFHSLRGKVFLGRYPLVISVMEAAFIALLCYCDIGLESPFRYYYFLSLICCAVRHPAHVTYATCALHGVSVALLYAVLPDGGRDPFGLALTLIMLGWVTWAAGSLAALLKNVGVHLSTLNNALQRQQAELELRIAERTAQLQESQAHVLHQEKMAAFGLLAAGIAHEVGNPLTSISSMVQMAQKYGPDEYVRTKLDLVSGQLARIGKTLRELVEFSRPAGKERTRISVEAVVAEALSIAKYYKRPQGRLSPPSIPPDLPPVVGVKDALVQVVLNLVLNAIDATDHSGKIEIAAERTAAGVDLVVRDTGAGIGEEQRRKLFTPYFTTKKHGTGLGLFVTRRLVADHGGTVTCESEPGVGTTFRVRLPAAEATA